jgi:hypothetical protein
VHSESRESLGQRRGGGSLQTANHSLKQNTRKRKLFHFICNQYYGDPDVSCRRISSMYVGRDLGKNLKHVCRTDNRGRLSPSVLERTLKHIY